MTTDYNNIRAIVETWLIDKKGWSKDADGVFRKTKKILPANINDPVYFSEYRIQTKVKNYGFICDKKTKDTWEFVKFVNYDHISHDANGNLLNVNV